MNSKLMEIREWIFETVQVMEVVFNKDKETMKESDWYFVDEKAKMSKIINSL
jgi:hypothetical protein